MEDIPEIVVETPQRGGHRGDLNYKLIVMRQIDRCGVTLSRLPHEMHTPNLSNAVGCKYEDITTSFSDGVRLLEALMTPYFDKEYEEQKKGLFAEIKKKKTVRHLDHHNFYFKRYGILIALCARLGLLLEPVGEEGV